MAKVLETLKQSETPLATPEGGVALAEDCATDDGEAGPTAAEVEFIEVGGRNTVLEASPAVLACSPRGEGKPPPPAALRPPPSGLSVAFQPVPALAAASQPAAARFAPELVAFHQPEQAAGRQFQTLATALVDQLPAARSRVVLFLAGSVGVGATTVLLNVAIALARQGTWQIAVVDANFTNPDTAGRFGVPGVPGLREVLAGALALPLALQETGQDNLLLLPAGTAVGHNIRLAGEGLRGLLRQLRDRFDLVLIDSPCWGPRPDTTVLATACDAVFVVVPRSRADDPATSVLLQTLARQDVPLRGQILTELGG